MKTIKKFNDFNKINEGAPNYDLLHKVENTEAYANLSSKVKVAIDEYIDELSSEIGYEEGDTDDDRAISLSIQSAISQRGW